MSSMAIAPAQSRVQPRMESPTHTGAGTLRLTRRGRLVVFLAGLVAVLSVLFVVLSDSATGTAERGQPVPVTMVKVESGDTLWTIASRAAPGEDPRDLIDQIEELNSLDGSLRVGSEIAVPLHH
jgi:LysM domain